MGYLLLGGGGSSVFGITDGSGCAFMWPPHSDLGLASSLVTLQGCKRPQPGRNTQLTGWGFPGILEQTLKSDPNLSSLYSPYIPLK